MRRILQKILFLILLTFPLMATANPFPVVEINLEIRNFSKNIFVMLEDLDRPFKVPSDGKLSLYAYPKDTIKLVIFSSGYNEKVLCITPKDYINSDQKNISYKTTNLIDFQQEIYSGKDIIYERFNGLEPYPDTIAWVIGDIIEKETGKSLENVTTGIFSQQHYLLYENRFEVSFSQKGYCYPVFKKNHFFVAVEKEGYETRLKSFSPSDFIQNGSSKNTMALIIHKDIELEKKNNQEKQIVLSFFTYLEQNLVLCEHVEVFNITSKRRGNTGNDYFYATPLPTEKTGFQFSNPAYGHNLLIVDPSYKAILFDQAKGEDKTIQREDIESNLSSIHPVFLTQAEDGESLRLMDLLDGDFSFSGRITDSETREPVKNATISLNKNEWVTYSNEQGLFDFGLLPKNFYEVQISKNGYINSIHAIDLKEDTSQTFFFGKVDLERNSGIEGAIFSEKSGEPIEGIVLVLDGSGKSCVTDKDGKYRFSGLPSGEYLFLNASTGNGHYVNIPQDTMLHRDYSLCKNRRLIDKKDKPAPQNYTMRKYGDLTGTLINLETDETFSSGTKVSLEGTDKKTTTDAKGEFVFKNIRDGVYRLLVHTNPVITVDLMFDSENNSDFIIPLKKLPNQVTIEEDQYEAGGEVVSREKKARNVNPRIFGKILSSDIGEYIIGANVLIEGTGRGAATGFGGDYIINNVNVGSYTIKASAVGFIEEAITVDVEKNEWVECVFHLKQEGQREPIYVFPTKRKKHPVSNWFLEGCLMVELVDRDGNPVIPQYSTIQYFPLDPGKTHEKKVDLFGDITVKNLSQTSDPYYLITFTPLSGEPFSLPFDVELIPKAVKPFLIFKVVVEVLPDGSIQLLNIEKNTEHFPPRKELLQQYPWLRQKYTY